MGPSKKYTLNKEDLIKISKVLAYSTGTTLFATIVLVLQDVQFPEEYMWLYPIANTLAYSIEKYLSGKINQE